MRKKILNHFEKVDKKLFFAIDDGIKKFTLEANLKPLKKSLDTKGKASAHFVSLCRSIMGQQLSGKAAQSIYQRFEDLFPRKNVTAKKILEFTEHELRAVGMSYGKARALRDLARKVLNKEVLFVRISEYSDEEIREMLIKVHGVGPWTIEMFLMFSLGREDIFSPKDLGLQKGMQRIYNLEERPNEEQMERFAKKWSPYRTYAALILWRLVDTK